MRKAMLVAWAGITLSLLGCSGDGPTGPALPDHHDSTPPQPVIVDDIDSISVVVGTLGSKMPEALQATWNGGSAEATIAFDGQYGRATIVIPQNFRGDVTLEIPGNDETVPSYRVLTHDEYSRRDVKFVMRPWKFEGVDIHMNDFIQSPYIDDPMPFMPIISMHIVGTESGTKWDYFMWPPFSNISVAIDAAASVPYLPSDAAMIWQGLNMLSQQLGGLYTFTPTTSANANWKITILDGGNGGSGQAIPDLSFNTRKIQSGNMILRGLTNLRNNSNMPYANTVVIHNAIHMLGFGHTCTRPSIMTSDLKAGPCQDLRTYNLDPVDVATIRFLAFFWKKQDDMGAPYGLAESYNGELVLMDGKPAYIPPSSPSTHNSFALAALN